jgi:hypothetical protein
MYTCEYGRKNGVMFGFVILNDDPQNTECGYTGLAEIITIPVMNIDYHFEEQSIEAALYKKYPRHFKKPSSLEKQREPPRPCAGVFLLKGFIMLLPVFMGQKYSYSYKPETGHYFLHDNEYKSYVYLQGDAARIFRKEIERTDNLPEGEYKAGLLTKNAIKFYL